MAEGNRITIGAKPLHVVDETFCSIPTNNCYYLVCLASGASMVSYKPAKNKGSSGSVPTASQMLKLAKRWRKRTRK